MDKLLSRTIEIDMLEEGFNSIPGNFLSKPSDILFFMEDVFLYTVSEVTRVSLFFETKYKISESELISDFKNILAWGEKRIKSECLNYQNVISRRGNSLSKGYISERDSILNSMKDFDSFLDRCSSFGVFPLSEEMYNKYLSIKSKNESEELKSIIKPIETKLTRKRI